MSALPWARAGGRKPRRPTDFAVTSAKPAVLYRCVKADGTLLYVGSSVDLRARVQYHTLNALWWSSVDRVETQEFDTLRAARVAEKRAIHDELPRWNIQWRNPNHPDGPAWVTDDIYDIHPGDCPRMPYGYVPEWGESADPLCLVEDAGLRRDARLARRAHWHETRRLLSKAAS